MKFKSIKRRYKLASICCIFYYNNVHSSWYSSFRYKVTIFILSLFLSLLRIHSWFHSVYLRFQITYSIVQFCTVLISFVTRQSVFFFYSLSNARQIGKLWRGNISIWERESLSRKFRFIYYIGFKWNCVVMGSVRILIQSWMAFFYNKNSYHFTNKSTTFFSLQDLQSEIETHRDVYTSLNGTGRKLLSSLASQDDAVMLQRRLDEMNQRWHHLKAKSMAIRWATKFFSSSTHSFPFPFFDPISVRATMCQVEIAWFFGNQVFFFTRQMFHFLL